MNHILREVAQPDPEMALAAFKKPGRMRRFLYEWANAEANDLGRLAKRFPEFQIPFSASPISVDFEMFTEWTRQLKNAWQQSDVKQKNLYLAWLLSAVVYVAKGNHAGWAYPMTGVLIEAIRIAERLAVCTNPDCPARLFIKSRKNQAQCTPECAAWAQRKWKREWWAAHGEDWRANRHKEKCHRKEK